MHKQGQWHGKQFYFGYHHDWHVNQADVGLGEKGSVAALVRMLKVMRPDFVQCDCKGHPGYTSWFSQTADASVPANLKRDTMADWRKATRQLGQPLHCHYSGIWDTAAGVKHPEWTVVGAEGQPADPQLAQMMCPRSPYVDQLMIPQMLELIDRYQVDGFWVDGDLWFAAPCYCARCRAAFTEKTGLAAPPVAQTDPNWPAWMMFTRQSFEEYATKYCDAVHRHKPGVLVCTNWAQTFRNPGPPAIPTDWLSGDNDCVWGLDRSRCEARFLSTRDKPWDIMLWNFYKSFELKDADSPWVTKPVQMLQQEAAVSLAFGGNIQIYQQAMRDGRLVPWKMKRLAAVGRFIKARRALCQDTQTIPQFAVLHSEQHAWNTIRGAGLMWSLDVAPVEGATQALLENQVGVDILDEWALLTRLDEFPVVVAPERNQMSEAMVTALKAYVARGGKLLISGADAFDRFGGDFLGVAAGTLTEPKTYWVPAQEGWGPLYSKVWRLTTVTTAKVLCRLNTTQLAGDTELPHPAATLNQVGKGAVLYIPGDVFRDYAHNRYIMARAFLGAMARKLAGRLPIAVKGPAYIDVVLRRRGTRTLVHLLNRTSGIPQNKNNGAIDEIFPVGPVTVSMRLPRRPRRVRLAFERSVPKVHYASGRLTVTVPQVHIHSAVVVDAAPDTTNR